MSTIRHPLAIALMCMVSLPAFAADLPVLNVYTYDSIASDWGPGPDLKKGFEQQCQCEVNFVVFDNAGTLKNRLLLEGRNNKADVVLGLDQNMVERLDSQDLFAPNGADASVLNIPFQWDATVYMPFDYGQYAFIYDETRLPNPPKSLEDLVTNDSVRVIYQDPRTSSVGSGLLMWVNQVFGDKAPEKWTQLAKHTVTVGKGWSSSYGLFLKGESDMALSYTTSPVYHQVVEGKTQYKAAPFTEGHPYQVELMAVTKNAKQPKLAQSFVQYVLSDEAQTALSKKNVMLPVTAVKVEGYDAMPEFKATQFKPMTEQQIADWTQVWQTKVSQ